MTAERNRYRSEAADAGRQADKLAQRLAAGPKASSSAYLLACLPNFEACPTRQKGGLSSSRSLLEKQCRAIT